jgi:hypothetical protein
MFITTAVSTSNPVALQFGFMNRVILVRKHKNGKCDAYEERNFSTVSAVLR